MFAVTTPEKLGRVDMKNRISQAITADLPGPRPDFTAILMTSPAARVRIASPSTDKYSACQTSGPSHPARSPSPQSKI